MTDAEPARDRVLVAALQEFARAGAHGARVAAIAATAGMNKRLLYHHVGDKEKLFQEASELARRHLSSGPVAGVRDRDAWRLLAFAEADGSAPELTPLLSGDLATLERLARSALAALVPALATALEAARAEAAEPATAAAASEPAWEAGRELPKRSEASLSVAEQRSSSVEPDAATGRTGKPRIRLKADSTRR